MSKYENDIVKILFESKRSVSGQKIAEQLNISRTAVWKAIDRLKDRGYTIESISNKGYQLVAFPKQWDSHLINSILEKSSLFNKGYIFDKLKSTQDEAEKIALSESQPFLVISETQTEGRGRFKRHWSSQPDTGLWMSVVLQPDISLQKLTTFNLFIALALANTVRHYHSEVKIKWPNDIYLNDKKLSGFLTEIKGSQDNISQIICGIGVNLNTERTDFPDELESTATSLQIETVNAIDRYEFLEGLLLNLEKYYKLFLTGTFSEVKEEYESYALIFERTLKYTEGSRVIIGRAESLNDDGTLNVKSAEGDMHRFISADIEL
ncbi:biotin--[acetyl-CoA-carboxylase] ligase [Macrococcoides canis]|uniref:biotin--[acetyl-CoA-carboxylase] ligase n=1 Tax=Macrococcoides canis TaxID=1855823 RepID=UPI00105CBD6A|nr:biotin--[acetyl-CoA-carboxylase] ligase [Macrococcus canis]TDM31800.1 biotin--[acetyl-CoA-carboxylase] ligase [Macrococcus canis]TDM34769.1 biotin--[acetyl-CoA-carboxylase] ligase [Macrococcus canis]